MGTSIPKSVSMMLKRTKLRYLISRLNREMVERTFLLDKALGSKELLLQEALMVDLRWKSSLWSQAHFDSDIPLSWEGACMNSIISF